MKIRFPVALLILSMIFSCKKEDPCESVLCAQNQQCVDGACVCIPGYKGADCLDQITPKKIIISKISVTRFPERKPNGNHWDVVNNTVNGELPDIYVALQDELDSVLFVGLEKINAVHTVKYSWSIQSGVSIDLQSEYTLSLWDRDYFLGVPTTVEKMGSVTFIPPYSDNNGFPNHIVIDNGGIVAFKLTVSYQW